MTDLSAMTLVDTGTAGPLVLNDRTAEFVRSLGYLILVRVDLAAAQRLNLRGAPRERSPDEARRHVSVTGQREHG